MIVLPQPSMALNAEDVPGPRYKMWNSMDVAETADPAQVLDWVAVVAKGAPGKRLKALVINCHGRNASLKLGTGIRWPQLGLFSKISKLVGEIYLVACETVSFSGVGDGNLFCGAMAKNAGAYVYASNSWQTTGARLRIPFGQIDGYEGQVWKWRPDGSNELTNL